MAVVDDSSLRAWSISVRKLFNRSSVALCREERRISASCAQSAAARQATHEVVADKGELRVTAADLAHENVVRLSPRPGLGQLAEVIHKRVALLAEVYAQRASIHSK